jgi:hypothetical protein
MTGHSPDQRPDQQAARRRFRAGLPMYLALVAVGVVWVLGCVWSYQEQSAFAADRGFAFPHLLPLVIDGFAIAMAGVAWAASLDARAAVPARLATLVAVAGSAASNGVWAALRTNHDPSTVVLAVAVPIAANLAFEVLLAELRRQVQRRRGMPAPVALPALRLIRVVLAPVSTFAAWRVLVLELTAPAATLPALAAGPGVVDADESTGGQARAATGHGGLDTYVSTAATATGPGLFDAHGSTPGGRAELDGGGVSHVADGWHGRGCSTPGVPSVPPAGGQEPLPLTVNGRAERHALAAGSGSVARLARGGGTSRGSSAADRARVAAEEHAGRTGAWPSVRELTELAEVGHGTAARELAALREAPTGLHVVTEATDDRPQQ